MGTNYYAGVDACEHYGRSDERLHIGKSSGGWVFCFEAHDDPDLATTAAWREHLARADVRICDEYGEALTVEAFWARVERTKEPWRDGKPPWTGESYDAAQGYTEPWMRMGDREYLDEGYRFVRVAFQ